MKKKFFLPAGLLLVLLSLVWSCNKDNSVSPKNNSASSAYYIKGLLGGEEIVISGTETAFKTLNDTLHHEDDEDEAHEEEENRTLISTGCTWTASALVGGGINTGSLELKKLVVRIYISPITSQQIYNMLEPNSYGFSFDKNAHSGAYITMRDKQGVLWTSKGDQTGSVFVIKSRGEQQGDYATFAGTFSCKMYDEYGHMKLLTNGNFSAIGRL